MDPERRAQCSELLEHPLFTQDSFHIRFLDELNAKIQKDHRENSTLPKITKTPRRERNEGDDRNRRSKEKKQTEDLDERGNKEKERKEDEKMEKTKGKQPSTALRQFWDVIICRFRGNASFAIKHDVVLIQWKSFQTAPDFR